MKKTGRVINFDSSKVYIITDDKEFVTLERNDEEPVKGSIYTGHEYIDRSKYIKIMIGIIIAALIALAGIKLVFFSSKATIVVDMYNHIKIGVNKDTIVSLTDINGKPFNYDGFPSVKGTELNEGLNLVFDYYYNNELLPAVDQYSLGTILIFITSNNKEALDFTKFKEYTEPYNYNVVVNRNNNEFAD